MNKWRILSLMLVINGMVVCLMSCHEGVEINGVPTDTFNEHDKALSVSADVAPGPLDVPIPDTPLLPISPAPEFVVNEGTGGYFGDRPGVKQKATTGNDDNECGDGELDKGEECDDGNLENGTFCSEACRISVEGCTVINGPDSTYILCSGAQNWNNAQITCLGFGPFNLATINSALENNFIETIVTAPNTWIGFNDQIVENTFVWVSGQPVTYLNWDFGEPNNDGNQDCTHFYESTGEWDDLGCETSLAFLCELNSSEPNALKEEPAQDLEPVADDAPQDQPIDEDEPQDELVEQPIDEEEPQDELLEQPIEEDTEHPSDFLEHPPEAAEPIHEDFRHPDEQDVEHNADEPFADGEIHEEKIIP